MTQNYHPIHFTHRIAEETQLLAEEKWIIEALNKVKSQRNCLQIERLQLESMKNQLRSSTSKNAGEPSTRAPAAKAPTTFSISMAAPKPPAEQGAVVLSTPNRRLLEAEASCNTETLQLGVDSNLFSSMHPIQHYGIEEYEEEEEENNDDLVLDMNMFMNCAQAQQQ